MVDFSKGICSAAIQPQLSLLLLRFLAESFASVPLKTIKTGTPEIIKYGIRAKDIDDMAIPNTKKNNPPNNIQPEISTHQGILPEDIVLIARPLR
ncbi:MAG: hypothetical protein RMY28_013660 [Nostoc sp. ChiSLP01]|nr:hypothetical protein [Nostoc sp. CmiSLP01]MDZ8284595.1 hypothetical protein [Nostoc sp. ChiSLP01]